MEKLSPEPPNLKKPDQPKLLKFWDMIAELIEKISFFDFQEIIKLAEIF
jgi:hypothetical protein